MNRIRFEPEQMEDSWRIINDKDEMLGYIEYDNKWEQFVYLTPDRQIKFAIDCLEAMTRFIKKQ